MKKKLAKFVRNLKFKTIIIFGIICVFLWSNHQILHNRRNLNNNLGVSTFLHRTISCFIIIGFNSVKLEEGVYFQAPDNIAQADSLYQKFKNVKTYIPKIWHLRSLILKMLSQITTSSLNSPWQLIESTFIILNSPKLNHLKTLVLLLWDLNSTNYGT